MNVHVIVSAAHYLKSSITGPMLVQILWYYIVYNCILCLLYTIGGYFTYGSEKCHEMFLRFSETVS